MSLKASAADQQNTEKKHLTSDQKHVVWVSEIMPVVAFFFPSSLHVQCSLKASNHCPVHLYSFPFKFSNNKSVIHHDKHIIHLSIMHLTQSFTSLLSKDTKVENSCCFMFRFSRSSCHAFWKTQERAHGGHILSPCCCSCRTTMALRPLPGHGGVVSVLEMEASFTAATPSVPSLKEPKQPAGAITWHISIQFPLQNVFIFRLMACHFAGAFGQELILESKQIFRGAIFHQVLIFLHSRSLYSLI